MDKGSSLIFIGLAVAWAIYLLPKAIRHHDEAARSRTVESFSHRLRVLARRDAVDRRTSSLVTPGAPAVEVEARTEVKTEISISPERARRFRRTPKAAPAAPASPSHPAELTPAQLRARRAAAARATKRRRNVLALVLVANLAVVALAAFGVASWWFEAIPGGLLVAWLVACRVMVKGERAALTRPVATPVATPPASAPVDRMPAPEEKPAPVPEPEAEAPIDPMEDTSAGIAAIVDPAMWDPVSVPLPTYVGKPAAARRTVRTIDLDDSGVWTSGRTDADAQIAREADEADRAARQARRDGDDERAFGS